MTVAENSVAKVVEYSEPVSVAGKAGPVIAPSQKTEVSSREARVARPQGFHPGQFSTALRRAHPAVFPYDLVPGQGSTAFGGAHHHGRGFVPGRSSTAPRGADFRPRRVCSRFLEAHWSGRGCAYGDACTLAHSWAKLHRERELASYFDA